MLMLMLSIMVLVLVLVVMLVLITVRITMSRVIFQGDTERLAKFKIRIEDPPRRKDMVMSQSWL